MILWCYTDLITTVLFYRRSQPTLTSNIHKISPVMPFILAEVLLLLGTASSLFCVLICEAIYLSLRAL